MSEDDTSTEPLTSFLTLNREFLIVKMPLP